MSCALCDADGGAVQPLDILDAAVALHDKALSVVEVDRPLPQAEGHTAQIGLRGIAVEHVDLARLQGGEPVLRRERDVTHLAGVAEHACGQRPAIVGVEPLVVALQSGVEKPANPALTPHTSVPRCLTVSSVVADAPDSEAASKPSQARRNDELLRFFPPPSDRCFLMRCRRHHSICRRSFRCLPTSRCRVARAGHDHRCDRRRFRPPG